MANKKRKKKKQRTGAMFFVVLLMVTLLLGAAIRLFVFEPVRVAGGSMETALSPGDVVAVNKLAVRSSDGIERGDVVLLAFGGGSGNYVRRVAGIPGDAVEKREDGLYINGAFAAELTGEVSLLNAGTIPDGYYLVLGDDRADNNDSRLMGLVSRNNIRGRCDFTVWPLAKLFRGL